MAVHIKVLLAGTFREIVGGSEIREEARVGTTLGDILTTLAKKYGKDFNEIIDSKTGQITPEAWVMVNGKSVRRTDIELRSNDTVMITVPAGGG